MTELSLFSVDVIPGKCGVEAQIAEDTVRFRASRPCGGWWRRKQTELSAWSGWFLLDDAPIALKWEVFEWPS